MTDGTRGVAEFDLIDRIRACVPPRGDVVVGIGDDAAVLQVPVGKQLVIATDTLNAGVHFPFDTAPADIGWKALAVNLSDLAAMGAQPAWCTLSLSLPAADANWVDGFLDGFLELASLHDVALVGGDTTRGSLSIGVTVHGFVEPGRALLRSAAQVGDEIWVSGTLGDAAAALQLLLPPSDGIESPAQPEPRAAVPHSLRLRLDRPTPRVDTGLALVGVAHAAIDLSDGLLADLAHVCRASEVAAELQLEALPASEALRHAFGPAQRHALQAAGGDDYELCFTAPATARTAIDQIALDTGVELKRIGIIVAGEGVRLFDDGGHPWHPARSGYMHFAD